MPPESLWSENVSLNKYNKITLPPLSLHMLFHLHKLKAGLARKCTALSLAWVSALETFKPHHLLPLFKNYFKIDIFGRERETLMRVKHRLASSCMPCIREQACNPSMCPDWELSGNLSAHRWRPANWAMLVEALLPSLVEQFLHEKLNIQ